MNFQNLILNIILVGLGVIHVIASIQDIKTREISDYLWLCSIPFIILNTYYIHMYKLLSCYIASLIFGLLLGIGILFSKCMGGADAKSIIVLSLATPPLGSEISLTNVPSLSIICNALTITLIYVMYNIAYNLTNFNKCKSRVGLLRKIVYIMILTCTPVYKIFKKPHAYTLAQDFKNGNVVIRVSLRVVGEDPRDILLKWISEGYVTIRDYVLTSYQLPFIVSITLGYLLYVFTGMNILFLIVEYIFKLII